MATSFSVFYNLRLFTSVAPWPINQNPLDCKAGGERPALCQCMHACLRPRSHYPLGTLGAGHSTVCEHGLWGEEGGGEEEEEGEVGVPRNTRGYSANLRGRSLSTLTRVPCTLANVTVDLLRRMNRTSCDLRWSPVYPCL